MNMLVFVLIYCCLDAVGATANVVLDNMTTCMDVDPPYSEKIAIAFDYKIYRNKGKTFINGRNTVLYEVPFHNFSITSYSIEGGRRALKFHIHRLNCRNFLSQAFLKFGNFRYIKKNCRLLKGSYPYTNLDLDRIFQGTPIWHGEGAALYRVSQAIGGRTVFCADAFVAIKPGPKKTSSSQN